MAPKKKTLPVQVDQSKVDKQNEKELTQLQQTYRNCANGQLTGKKTKEKMRNLIKNLDQMKWERHEVKANLAVATGTTHVRLYEEHMKVLDFHVGCLEEIQKSIDTVKTEINHLNHQLKRLDSERFRCNSKGISNNQFNLNLKKSQQTKESLENRLDVSKKQKNLATAQNYQLRMIIVHMMYERQRFNKIWRKMIVQLAFDKKFLIDIAERAIMAFNKGADVREKLNSLCDRAKRDKTMHITEMVYLIQKMDADDKLRMFLGNKGYRRKINDLEEREYKRRTAYKQHHIDTIELYTDILNRVQEFTEAKNIPLAATKFEKKDSECFAHFNYMNNLNSMVEYLKLTLKSLHKNIDESRDFNARLQEHADEKVKSAKLIDTERNVELEKLQQEKEERNAYLQFILKQIGEIFRMLRCDDSSLKQLLGDQSEATMFNVQKMLAGLESRLNTVLNVVYFNERKEKSRQSLEKIEEQEEVGEEEETDEEEGDGEYEEGDELDKVERQPRFIVRGVEEERIEPHAIEEIVLVQQCPECAEGGEVNQYDEEIVLPNEMPEIRKNVRMKTQAPEMQFRLHSLSKCRLPRSRTLLNKRYQ